MEERTKVDGGGKDGEDDGEGGGQYHIQHLILMTIG